MNQAEEDAGLLFYLNGRRVQLLDVDPTALLVDYLRSPEVGLTGTKIGCKQGGCGACTVLLSRWNGATQEVEHRSINSCLRPLAALDGMMITTVEGCGSVKSGCISGVQNGLATNNGTQCGYCTPGWIMNMTAAVAQKGPKPGTKAEIEALFDGNLCRCTGYRPILYGFKKEFASDWDVAVDERGCMVCDVDPAEKVDSVAPVNVAFPDELKRAPRAVHFERDGYVWCRPSTLAGVTSLLREYTDRSQVRLVGGNTSAGVYPRTVENPHVFIDIAHLQELCDLRMDEGTLRIGGGVSYADLLEFLDVLVAERKSADDPAAVGLAALQYMARRTAGTIVRNAATLAGNTMMVVRHCAQGVPFPSDCYTAMGALGANVTISSPQHPEPQQIDLLELPEHWQRSPDMQGGCIVLHYELRMTRKDEFAQTYKTALREVNAHSIVNGGFRVRLDADHCVADAVIVLGGIAPSATRMIRTETIMRDRRWDSSMLAAALTELSREIGSLMECYAPHFAKLPDEGFSPEYKRQLAQSFVYKFFIEVCEWRGLPVPPDVQSGGCRPVRPVSKGTQAYVDYPDEYPVNIPYAKIESFLQSTGEAQYTQDIALPQTGFNGAPVQSTVAKGSSVYSVPDVSGPATPQEVLVALKKIYPSVVDYVTAVDVPGAVFGGMANDDPVFAVSVPDAACDHGKLPSAYDPRAPLYLTGFGQCIGLVLAADERTAQEAAEYLQQHFCAFTAERPIIELPNTDAQRNQLVYPDQPASAPWYSHIWKITRAGTSLDWVPQRAPAQPDLIQPVLTRGIALSSAHHGKVSCTRVSGSQRAGGQIHFYMETQSCYVEPLEDRQVRAHASTQDANAIQGGIARVLGLSLNKVDVRVRRIGGGYGGKCGQSVFAASMAAVAAWKLGRPVRVAMSRQVDSAMFGHRHPVLGNYHVAIGDASDPRTHGKLFGYQADYWLDGGRTYDCSLVVSDCLALRSDSAYFIPNWNCVADVCRTDKTSNTSMRTMGMIQAAIIVEDAIEGAAHGVGLIGEEVRARNLYRQGQATPYGEPLDSCYMKEVWDYAMEKSGFAAREKNVSEFNAQNRWRKRGISLIPVKYGSGFNLTMLEQGGALIEVYEQDGSILVRHGGIEMGQGLNTKIAQIVAVGLNVPIGTIRVAENDTAVVPNPQGTGASTGTSFNGGAAQKACHELRERLEKFCLELRETNGEQWCRDNNVNFWDYPEGWRATIPNHSGKTLWQCIVSLAYSARLNLSAQARIQVRGGESPDSGLEFKLVNGKPASEPVDYFNGYTYSAACTEVEIDVLTGEVTILRSDVVYDAGRSLNPAVDIGQVEGGFVQGLGYAISEELTYQPVDSTTMPQPGQPAPGALYTVNTWEYKPPAAQSIPQEMNIMMFPRELAASAPPDKGDLMSSKEMGEPPMTLAVTAFFAIKKAIMAARKDRGYDEWFSLDAPANAQRVRDACLVAEGNLTV